MDSREKRVSGQGRLLPDGESRRTLSRAALQVESLEGRTLLSYLINIRHHKVISVYGGDASVNQPLFSNGIAAKHAARFYPLYTGPRVPGLNGVSASGQISGNLNKNGGNLILTGNLAGPIIAKPKAGQEASYVFAVNRGGASATGPFPGRPHIRFDTQVVVNVRTTGVKPFVLVTAASTNQPNTAAVTLSASSVVIKGNSVKVTVPLSDLPSNGKAINQWTVNFSARNLDQFQTVHSIASFMPEFTNFQVRTNEPHVPNVF